MGYTIIIFFIVITIWYLSHRYVREIGELDDDIVCPYCWGTDVSFIGFVDSNTIRYRCLTCGEVVQIKNNNYE